VTQPVPARLRLAIATLLGMIGGHYVHFVKSTERIHRDFAQVWYAARAVLHGNDPYVLIGPGRAFEWDWPFYYPLTAAVVATPVAFLSEHWAMVLVGALSCFVLAWALMEFGYASLLAFGSFSVWEAVQVVQWSPLMAGAYVIPPLALILAAKPTVGAAMFAAKPSRWALVGGVVVTTIAFIVQPQWVAEWRAALASPAIGHHRDFEFIAPVMQPGGFLVLAALARWRRPEARLLVALACVPQTILPYETVLLFLVPRGWLEVGVLVVLSHAIVLWSRHVHPVTMRDVINLYGQLVTWGMYLPLVAMLLRRPNEGTVPTWLERQVLQWPIWIRGTSGAT
jgi:hypothetical protein